MNEQKEQLFFDTILRIGENSDKIVEFLEKLVKHESPEEVEIEKVKDTPSTKPLTAVEIQLLKDCTESDVEDYNVVIIRGKAYTKSETKNSFPLFPKHCIGCAFQGICPYRSLTNRRLRPCFNSRLEENHLPYFCYIFKELEADHGIDLPYNPYK